MTFKRAGLGWKIVVAAGLVATAGVADAYAASCKQADLKGKWLVELSTETVCKFEFDKSGAFKNAPCRPQGESKVEGTATGKLKVEKDCDVTGKFEFDQKKGKLLRIKVDGKMNKNKDMITGMAESQFGEATFKAYEQ